MPRVIFSMCLTLLTVLTVGCGIADGNIIGGTFTKTSSDTTPRFFHRAGLLQNGHVLVSGGMRVNLIPPTLISLSDLSFFDPSTNSFSTSFQPINGVAPVSPSLSVSRSSHTQTTLPDGRVLFTGGRTGAAGTNPGTPVDSVEIFDPFTGIMQPGPTMSATRADHTATLLPDGRIVVAGGSTWQVFDPTTDSWSPDAVLQRTRVAHAAVMLPDHAGAGQHRVILIGGNGSGPNTLELLNPDGAMSTLSSAALLTGVDDLAAVRLDDGTVLIVGGQNTTTGETIDSGYRYDPATDTIAATTSPPNLSDGIADHEIIVIGRFALIFGGEQEVAGVDTELDYAAIYDRATGDWPFVTNMNHPHDDFASILLPDNRILLIDGGIPFLNMEIASNFVEFFTPSLIITGDVNRDELLDEFDILPFIGVLLDPSSASSEQLCAADANQDQSVDARDLQGFINLLLTHGEP